MSFVNVWIHVEAAEKAEPPCLHRRAYPLEVEQIAAWAMLDEKQEPLPQSRNDHNVYKLGSINNHNLVIAGLHQPGNFPIAAVVTQMRTTFPNLEFGLLNSIGGGVPVETDEGMSWSANRRETTPELSSMITEKRWRVVSSGLAPLLCRPQSCSMQRKLSPLTERDSTLIPSGLIMNSGRPSTSPTF